MDHYSHTVWRGDWQPAILWQQTWLRGVPAMYIDIEFITLEPNHPILSEFAKQLQEGLLSSPYLSVRLSVREEKERLPPYEISRYFLFGIFTKICRHVLIWIKSYTTDLHMFMLLCHDLFSVRYALRLKKHKYGEASNVNSECKCLRNTDCKCTGCDTSTMIDCNHFAKTLTNVIKFQYWRENINEFNTWEQ
jgi:hypothetical protein